ncbi:spindle and kinetochore-associated protein 3 isoform X1 [Conger conger]|uniref:spindle and kinetochore-associated protein 3 isoform X1 n=2 Tax=Conger conger TaxID=82655 RepID=UPI002A5A4919|nr:spindle and kinetochore-associated protein 3 isoform X1 [Conger conger]
MKAGMATSSACFFGKLRNLAVFLETETAKLQQAHQNTADDSSTEGAVRVLHELKTEVRDLRREVQGGLARFEVEGKEMRKRMQMFLVLKQRTTEDIQRLKKHYEKYGYKAPTPTQKHSELKSQEAEEVGTGVEEEEEEGDEEKRVKCDEAEEQPPCVTPAKIPPPDCSDPMRTPRLSDFGLSELSIMKALGKLPITLGEAPEAPRLTSAALEPALPKTPKCALRMDEEALTPRLEDFGITEHTMCLNNDFTMDLIRKDSARSSRTADSGDDLEMFPRANHSKNNPAPTSATSSPDTSGHLASPEPVLVTPGFKMKAPAPFTTPLNKDGDSWASLHPTGHPSTPEIPVFETPYVQKLFATVKPNQGDHSVASAVLEQKPRPLDHSSSNRGPVLGGGWTFDAPSLPVIPPQPDERTPEMPCLETFLGTKFPFRTTEAHGIPERKELGEQPSHQLPVPETHNPYSLATPPSRTDYVYEPSTPEMPDISSVTQDIFRLLSQRNAKPSTDVCSKPKPAAQPSPKAAATMPHAVGKENRPQGVALVSESEFLSLPGFLRQMSLASLNQAIQKINEALDGDHSREDTDSPGFLMDDLKCITGVGIKTPVYFLCLTELKRLEHVQGEGHAALYRVLTPH